MLVSYNIITSHGEKLNLEFDTSFTIENICIQIFNMVENIEYINTFDLTLRYDNIILQSDKSLIEYNIPENSKLSFILRRKSIDIPSPGIYDSPLSIKKITDKYSDSYILKETQQNVEKLIELVYDLKDNIDDLNHDIKQIKTDLENVIKDKNPLDLMD